MLKLNSQKKNAIFPELGGFADSAKNFIGKVAQAESEIRPMGQEGETKIYLQNNLRKPCYLLVTGTE